MAFGTKYRIEGTSDIYGKVTANIQKNNYTGSVNSLEGSGRTWIELSVGQGGNDISLAVLPSQLSLQFYASEDFETIELAQDPPYTWRVDVLDGNDDLIWRGWINPEAYNENYHNTPYVVNLIASDGLDELKTVPYTLQSGKAFLWDHIVDSLNTIGLNIPIYESVNIYDDEMDDNNEDSPFTQAEITYNSFLKLGEEPNCYDVLTAILKPFYSRIYQYRGWRIENIYGKKEAYIERLYQSNGAYVSNQSVDPLRVLSNDPTDFSGFLSKSGNLAFHPALDSTEVYFDTQEIANLAETGGFSLNTDWVDDNNLVSWTKENSLNISRLPFGFNGSETILRIQGIQSALSTQRHIASNTFNIDEATFQNIAISFDYWMNYPSVIILGTKPILYLRIDLVDTTNNVTYYFRNGSWSLTEQYIRIDAPGRQTWRSFSVNINTLPVFSGTGTIRYRIYQLVKSGSDTLVEVNLTNWATTLQVEELVQDLLLRESATQNSITTFRGPSFQHFISDGTVIDREGVMDVDGVLTGNWNRRGKTDNLNIRRLFILQWLTMHQSQAAKLQGTILQKGEKLTPISVVQDDASIDNRKYIFNTWRFNLSNGTGDIQYHEVFETESSPFYFVDLLENIAPNTYIMPDFSFPVGAPGLSPGVQSGGGINIPSFNIPPLSGDVRGDIGSAELTPAAIVQKPTIDYTGLKSSDVAMNIVPDSLDEEQMSKTTAKDLFGAWTEKNPAVGDDEVVIRDSADSNELKRSKIKNLGLVPYQGANANVNLGEFGLSTGHVVFDTTPTNTPTSQGTMAWDTDNEAISVILNGYKQIVGANIFYPVKNQTGSSIAKGTAVRFAGTLGNSGRLLIAPFIANGSVQSTFFMGVTAETIANGADGKVLWFGALRGINTNAFNEGDILYASTSTAGAFQTAVPQAPNNIVQIAAVVTKSTNVGSIFIRPTLGSNINKDEGVKITTPATGQLLQLQSNSLWENKTLAQILGGTSSQFVKGDGSLDSNTYQLLSEKGNANGYASLDGNGKVPLTQINDALLGNVNFQGLWNASTNTPTLVNPPSSATKGHYYIVDTAGTFASISFEVGDWIISNGTTWNKVDNTDAVSSVFGRTGNVTAQSGDYNTSQVTESGNLYFTDARARAALSFTAGSGAYNSTTGVITIPTNNNQITNGAGYITSAALGAYLPLTGGTLTGNLSGTNVILSGDVTANRYRGVNSLVLNNFTTVNPSSNVYLYSPLNDRDAWIYLDSADTGSNWGIYHRQIDTTVGGLEANSIGFVGGGTNTLQAWIGLGTGNGYYRGDLTANKFIKSGGTSSQFLKANGDVDSNTYALTNQTMHIGTTAVAINRASSAQTLTGVSIDGTSTGVVRTVTGTNSAELVRGNMADNDQARILVGGTASNAGFLEIATADDGTEPIHVRQYTGVFTNLIRTATLLDGSGNTSFPGVVRSTQFELPDGGKFISFGGTQSYYSPNSGASEISYQSTLNFRAFNAGSPLTAMFLASNGKVGIGTPLPSAKLDVSGSHVGSIGLLRLTSSTTTDLSAITYYQSNQYRAATFVDASNNFNIWSRGTGNIVFNTLDSITPRMTITSGGNVLINTTSDDGTKLQVSGQGTITDSQNGFNLNLTKTAGFGAIIQLKNTSALSNDLIRILDSSNNIISRIFPVSGGISITSDVLINTTGITGGGRLQVNGAVNCSDPTEDRHAVTRGWANSNLAVLRTAGDSGVGAVRYAGNTRTEGQFYGGTSNPSSSTFRLNYDGNFVANALSSRQVVEGLWFSSQTSQSTVLQINDMVPYTGRITTQDHQSLLSIRSIGTPTNQIYALLYIGRVQGTRFADILTINPFNSLSINIVNNVIQITNTSNNSVSLAFSELVLRL